MDSELLAHIAEVVLSAKKENLCYTADASLDVAQHLAAQSIQF